MTENGAGPTSSALAVDSLLCVLSTGSLYHFWPELPLLPFSGEMISQNQTPGFVVNWSRRQAESSCISFSPLGPVLAHPLPPSPLHTHTSFLSPLHMQTLDPASWLSPSHTVWLRPVFGYINCASEISALSLSSPLTRGLHACVCGKWGVSLGK